MRTRPHRVDAASVWAEAPPWGADAICTRRDENGHLVERRIPVPWWVVAIARSPDAAEHDRCLPEVDDDDYAFIMD